MNERIKKLAEQALPNIKYWNDEHAKEIEAPINRAVTVDELEKFSELIVLEVLNVQENLMANGHNAWHLHKPTKKHFGIEK